LAIPSLDMAPLFEAATVTGGVPARNKLDAEVMTAAREVGFMTVHGVPDSLGLTAEARDTMLAYFHISPLEQRKLWKRNFEPANRSIYRGHFPRSAGPTGSREGFDIGPDVLRELRDIDADDLLYEATPMPSEALAPGWRKAAANWYGGMETIGAHLLACVSRGLGIDESIFASAFENGISTLRLLHYAARDSDAPPIKGLDDYYASFDGCVRELVARPHVDSGLLTILSGHGVSGLQAQADDGQWLDVPLREGSFAINFGGLLERWTGGQIKATRHRVLGQSVDRYSIPFFFEARPNTRIEPLPIPGIKPFTPFLFGDYLWTTATRFPENKDLAYLRSPRAPYEDPSA
jgi:isopenicillin N synthase-like dioxygenase